MDKLFIMKWMRGFFKRWLELKVLKLRGFEYVRAKMVLKEIVVGYFKNFEKIFLIYNMYDKFYLIYNVDEKGILIDYKFFLVVSDLIYCL